MCESPSPGMKLKVSELIDSCNVRSDSCFLILISASDHGTPPAPKRWDGEFMETFLPRHYQQSLFPQAEGRQRAAARIRKFPTFHVVKLYSTHLQNEKPKPRKIVSFRVNCISRAARLFSTSMCLQIIFHSLTEREAEAEKNSKFQSKLHI